MGLSLMDANKIVSELNGNGDFELLAFLFYLVDKAAEADIETPFGPLKAGQIAISIRGIADDFRLSKSSIHRRLAKLANLGAVTVRPQSKSPIITLNNYAKYLKLRPDTNTTAPEPKQSQPAVKNKPPKKEATTKTPAIFAEDSPAFSIANLLAKFIRIRNPTAKLPNLQSWATDADRIHRLDGREWEDIEKVLRFSQKHHFWQMNILSIDKLRKHYDRLTMEMKNERTESHKDGNKPSLKTSSDKREHRFREVVSKYS